MHVRVDHERCIASGSCVLVCPEVFAQDEEGVVVLLEERPDERLRSAVEAAVDSCPAMCIDLED